MGKIVLEGLEFFAYHGYHEEERNVGNRYGVDIVIETNFAEAALQDELSRTVDYAEVYNLVQAEMQKPARLLEHVAQRITDGILAAFASVAKVQVTVSKFNPPLGGICRRAYVELINERNV